MKDVINKINKQKNENRIDLSGLIWLSGHGSFNNHQMQILEEVAFLCINRNFVERVNKARVALKNKFVKVEFPIENTWRAERFLEVIYRYYYKQYKSFIEGMLKDFKLLPSLYWRDKLEFLEMDIEDYLREERWFGGRDMKISKREAREEMLDKALEDSFLELLDSIIIRNAPLKKGELPLWCNQHLTRGMKGIFPVELKKDGVPGVQITFPIYATLSEMQKLLKENYNKIQKIRSAATPLLAKRDHRKDNLAKMLLAHELFQQGKSLAKISVELDKIFGGYISFEGVRVLVQRAEKEASRFKQET
jgi:hypothetical protein